LHDSAVGTIVNVASVNAVIEPDAGVLDYGDEHERALRLAILTGRPRSRRQRALDAEPRTLTRTTRR
jgi:hypothetical protein